VNTEKLKAERGKFRFVPIDWKAALPRDIKEGKDATTSTTWTLHQMTRQPSFHHFFPLLLSLAECCLSIPVSNAWPERGASALKHVKPRLHNRLKNDMLRALLQVSINGPRVESDTCAKIVRSATDAWNRASKRSNLHVPQTRGNVASIPEAVAAHVAQVQVADAAMQADDDEYREHLIPLMKTREAEAEEATAALKLTKDEFEAEDDLTGSDYNSDYDCEY